MEEGLQVYPNPATSELNIETAVEDHTVAYIYSYTGAFMRTIELDKDINTISIDALTPGMYVIVVNNDDEVYRQKFIKR